MKAITIWQPWASLIQTRAKKFETRSWKTDHRGLLLICSAKGGLSKKDERLLLSDHVFQDALQGFMKSDGSDASKSDRLEAGKHLPRGMALCLVELKSCVHVSNFDTQWKDRNVQELMLGDFVGDRYAWELDFLGSLTEPYPIKGKQRLWTVENSDVSNIISLLDEE